ncbi:MAG TPA: helix-turn-helix domain-containing protein, partial [Azospirillum sp.]
IAPAPIAPALPAGYTANGYAPPTAVAAVARGNGAGISGLVGRTVADVERDLIIGTLSHCLGNRTHAANILGISIRTLRNKLKLYNEEGVPVPPPGAEDRAVPQPAGA